MIAALAGLYIGTEEALEDSVAAELVAEGSARDGVRDAGGGERGRGFFVERDGWIFVERVFGAGGIRDVGGFVFGWCGHGFAAAALNDRARNAVPPFTFRNVRFTCSTCLYALSSPSNIRAKFIVAAPATAC